jgi:CheY-like chemotaxis protein
VAKILVADDNSNIQKMVGLALKDQGIDVVAVGNGEAAVRKISDIRPDLVLADVFMPVRNGYEVCRYVKEDSSLAHIPVILLVGAFDPLDEQEAQRVGADGVLKKPFVPPDPLISMVKSALARAGVSIGPASAEKAPPPPKRSTADILGGGTKLVPPVPVPEVSPEPLEEFAAPAPPPHLKIAAGSEPLAFGSLLDTSDAEDLAITAKPMIELAKASKWETDESDEIKEEEEESEEPSGSVWRPGGIDETIERAAQTSEAAPDWRDEAFHGSSPASGFSSKPWNPSEPQPSFAEAAESHSVAVATVEHKPAVESAPFAGDAWAAAMAAGVEDKIAELKEAAPAEPQAPEVQQVAQQEAQQQSAAPAQFAPAQEAAKTEPAPAIQPPVEQASEPANWAAAPATAWELEAKKASQLASTWDSPKTFAVDETQEVAAYSSENSVEHAHSSAPEAPAEQSAYSAEPIVEHEPEHRTEAPASEGQAETPAASHEAEPKSLHTSWEFAPAAAPAQQEPVVEHTPAQSEHVEQAPAPVVEERVAEEPIAEQKAPESAAAPKLTEPDMDELVARVLGKMNPDVLQKVTREILKPVIEAIVRDEINSKKS